MTEKTQPTGAELWQLWIPMAGRSGVADPVDFARAVLQRWGQPSGAGEPVARIEIGRTKGGISLTHIAEPAAFQLPEGMYALYTAPQPTQTQAVAAPMSHETAKALVRKYGNDLLHLVYQVEVAHGITQKGGQHGAE